MAIEKHYATVSQEGEAGPIRGKIPTGLTRALRCNSGDMIEFETQGRFIIGGKVLTQKEASKIREPREVKAPAKSKAKVTVPTAKSKSKVKASVPVAKSKKSTVSTPAPKGKVKQTAPAAKTNKRKTKVAYEEPARKTAPGGKKKISFGKKR